MVCDQCISSVKKILASNNIIPYAVSLGEVEIEKPLSSKERSSIKIGLTSKGYKLIDNHTPILVTKIKSALVTLFDQNEIPEEFKLSTFLCEKFSYDYSHLSRVFSHHEKDTIEHYLIWLRIEKAKELLSYKNTKVTVIAYKLGYASIAHFSRQFKEKVGVAPSIFQNNPSGKSSWKNFKVK